MTPPSTLYNTYRRSSRNVYDDGTLKDVDSLDGRIELEHRILDEVRRHFEAIHLVMPGVGDRLLGAQNGSRS